MLLRSGITYESHSSNVHKLPSKSLDIPPEVQDMIWHALAQTSRIIEVCRVDSRNDVPGHVPPAYYQDDHYKGRIPVIAFRRPSLPILSICRRSRAIAMLYYRKMKVNHQSLWFNPSQDTFYLGPAAMRYNDATYFGDIETDDNHAVFTGYGTLLNLQYAQMSGIARIALGFTFWDGLNESCRLALLYSFPDLKEMVLISGDEYTVDIFDQSEIGAGCLTEADSKTLVYHDGDQQRSNKLKRGKIEFRAADRKDSHSTQNSGKIVTVPDHAFTGHDANSDSDSDSDSDPDNPEEVTFPEYSFMAVLRDGMYWGDIEQLSKEEKTTFRLPGQTT